MTIYRGKGKGTAHTIEQKEVFVQFREEVRGGEGGLIDKVNFRF